MLIFLDRALIKAVKYVQSQNFGAAIDVFKQRFAGRF